ncbi:unnamed protein product [Closterium sp. NIES-53]
MLPASPQQNGIAERCIGLVMEATRTSMIHAAASHFLWPFAVQYTARQLNLWPHVSLTETSPTLQWTGKVGNALVFRVWGSCSFVRDMSANKISSRAIPCIFLGFPLDAPGWQFYHPTSRRVLSSQDVTFDESVPFYSLFPYCSSPLPPPPLFLAPGPPPVDPLSPQGRAPLGVSQVDPLPGFVPVEVTVDSGAARGAASWGAEPWGAEPGGARTGGTGAGGTAGVGAGGTGAGAAEGTGAAGGGGAAGFGAGGTGAGATGGSGVAGSGDARSGGTGARGAGGAAGVGTGDLGARDPGDGGAADVAARDPKAGGAGLGGASAVGAGFGDCERPRPYFVPLLQEVLCLLSSIGLTPPLLCPPPDQSQLPLQPASPLIVHSSAYQSLALTSTFGRVRRAKLPVSRACGLPHALDDLYST